MPDPTPPLWEVMAEACAEHTDGIADLKPGAIAAMICAMRDRVVPDEGPRPDLSHAGTRWDERQRLRALLTAEADRAERGHD